MTAGRLLLTVLSTVAIGSFNSCGNSGSPVDEAQARFPLAAAQRVDAARLSQAYDLARNDHGMKCLLVARNGVLVGEEYFNTDGKDSLYHVRSVTKSVVSILFGIAVDRSLIRSLDLTLKELLGDYVDSLSATTGNITIRQLLTMSGGFQWEELRTTYDLAGWSNSRDQVAYVLGLPIANPPGTQFTYNTAACQLLSAIFKGETGMSLYDFAVNNLFQPISIVGPILIFTVASLDVRNGWTPEYDLLVKLAFVAVVAAGTVLPTWAIAHNRFFSSVVRIQHDRGHVVVSTGPYSVIRHPAYAGSILAGLAMPVALGSLWGLVPAALTAIAVIVRTALEDRTLRKELAGYAEYVATVRYRLIPGIW